MLRTVAAWLDRPPRVFRWDVAAIGLGLLGAVSLVDYATGTESLFFIFYFIPVALCAWLLAREAAQVMAVASGTAWWLVDRAGGHVYSHELYRAWNALVCLGAFLLVAWGVSEIRAHLEKQRRLSLALAETLEAHKRATEQIRQLQSHIQTFCAWTKRIRVEDEWVSVEEFLRSRLGIQVTHCTSAHAGHEPGQSSDGRPARRPPPRAL